MRRVGAEVDAALDEFLSLSPAESELGRPRTLIEAMRYGALGPGKRLRPFLVVETARALGRVDGAPVSVGAAIECVHAYSLIHDDLPAMDDDDLRRGRPTVHRVFGEANAILAGDALLTLAFEILSRSGAGLAAEARLRIVAGLARAAGLAGMVGGQTLDLEAERRTDRHDAMAVERIQAMKTGALIGFSVEAGAILGAAEAERMAALVDYGRALGAAFQLADDILDAEGEEEALGKRVRKDAERNKPTFVAVLGLEAARGRRDALTNDALQALDRAALGAAGETLAQAARFASARKS